MTSLTDINAKLTTKAFLEGAVPTKADADLFNELFGSNKNTAQWAARMASYFEVERQQISGAAAPPAAAAPKAAEHKDPKAASKDNKAAPAAAAKKEEPKVAKSNITLEILPNGSDVDMDGLVTKLKAIQKDGLAWGESRLEPVAFGIKKLLLAIQIEDAKISATDIEKVVMSLNDGKEEDEGDVQSVEIATWQPVGGPAPEKK